MIEQYDLIVLATKDKTALLKKAFPYYLRNLTPKSIYIIANKNIEKEFVGKSQITFINEDSVLNGLTKIRIESIIKAITGSSKRAGWYLQQFIKLAWALKCQDKCYVVIDSDTIPLNPITFINEQNRYLITKKIEHHKAYFDTIEKLFSGTIRRPGNYSFIAENMIFDSHIVRKMIKDIECNGSIQGENFYEKIMYAINPDDILGSGFSEFETYGCYLSKYFPSKFELRNLRTSREAVYILGSNPSETQLEWAKKDYDMISIEVNNYKSMLTKFSKVSFFRVLFSMKLVSKIRTKTRTFYRKLLKRPDFLYD